LLYAAFSFFPAFFFGLGSDSTGSNRMGMERAVTPAIRCKGRIAANWMMRIPLMKLT